MCAAAVQQNWIMQARAKCTLLYFILFLFLEYQSRDHKLRDEQGDRRP